MKPNISSSNKTAANTPTTTTTSNVIVAALEVVGIMLLKFPVPLRLWILVLMYYNVGGLAMFPNNGDIRFGAALTMSQGLIMGYLYQYHGGFTKLLSVGHAPWLVYVPWLWYLLNKTDQIEDDDVRYHLVGTVVVDAICLLLDLKDFAEYTFGGKRQATIVWKTKAN